MYSIIQFFLLQEGFNKLFIIIIIIIIIIKIIKSIGDQKSLWIMNLEDNSCGSYESWRRKRQESWISRFKWFRFDPRFFQSTVDRKFYPSKQGHKNGEMIVAVNAI